MTESGISVPQMLQKQTLQKLWRSVLMLIVAVLFLAAGDQVSGQGSLTPPGPPSPLFKTLDQVEPRRPISSLPFNITQPGSYYVTTNLVGVAGQNGIMVDADCVTIDLMGFELRGVAGSLSGILLNAGTRTCIYNGCLRNWGQDGINGGAGAASVLERLRVATNGRDGIATGNGSQVRLCIATGNARNGIVAGNDSDVDDSASNGSGVRGIQVGSGSNVRRCLVSANLGNGITTGDSSSVISCNANDAGNVANPNSAGITVGGGCTVRDCTTRNNSGNGITASFGCNVADTDPLDPASRLQITFFSANPGGSPLSVRWTSRCSRCYYIEETTDLNPPITWSDSGLGLIAPDVGPTTTRNFADAATHQRFSPSV